MTGCACLKEYGSWGRHVVGCGSDHPERASEVIGIGATTEAPRAIIPSHGYIGYGPALGFYASCACGRTDVLANPKQAVMDDAMIQRARRWFVTHPCGWRRA